MAILAIIGLIVVVWVLRAAFLAVNATATNESLNKELRNGRLEITKLFDQNMPQTAKEKFSIFESKADKFCNDKRISPIDIPSMLPAILELRETYYRAEANYQEKQRKTKETPAGKPQPSIVNKNTNEELLKAAASTKEKIEEKKSVKGSVVASHFYDYKMNPITSVFDSLNSNDRQSIGIYLLGVVDTLNLSDNQAAMNLLAEWLVSLRLQPQNIILNFQTTDKGVINSTISKLSEDQTILITYVINMFLTKVSPHDLYASISLAKYLSETKNVYELYKSLSMDSLITKANNILEAALNVCILKNSLGFNMSH